MNEWRSGRIFSLMTCCFLLFLFKTFTVYLHDLHVPGFSLLLLTVFVLISRLGLYFPPFYVLVFLFFKIVATLKAARKWNCEGRDGTRRGKVGRKSNIFSFLLLFGRLFGGACFLCLPTPE